MYISGHVKILMCMQPGELAGLVSSFLFAILKDVYYRILDFSPAGFSSILLVSVLILDTSSYWILTQNTFVYRFRVPLLWLALVGKYFFE